jgi:hypothetical protein
MQAVSLVVGRLVIRGGFDPVLGDLAGRLIDTRLPRLNAAQAGVKSSVSGDFHTTVPQFIKRTTVIEAD